MLVTQFTPRNSIVNDLNKEQFKGVLFVQKKRPFDSSISM